MRKWPLFAAVIGLCLSTRLAVADFQVTAVRTDLGFNNSITTNGNGTIPGYFGMVEFFAKNLGTNGTGTKLNALSLTLSDAGPGNLVIGGYAGTGTPSGSALADLYGQNEISSNGTSYIFKETQTSTTSAPKYVTFVNALGDPTSASDNNPNNVTPSLNGFGFNPANAYSNYGYAIKSFSVDYGSLNGGVNATTANGGRGALFAVAVVPITDSVQVQGSMAGDLGPTSVPFNYTNTVVLGDANLNAVVDLPDYNAVVRNFGTGTTWTQGDFDQAATVDLNDYNTVVRNFGLTSSASPAFAAAAAVPEPAAASFLLVTCLSMCIRRRSRA